MAAFRLPVLAAVVALPGSLVVNEILYDPAGADAGGEFVELINVGASTLSLAGVRLEFANGADEPAWQAQWTAAAGDAIPASATFLIVDAGWDGTALPDAVADLALQNGPDALRLVRDAVELDRIGYGPLDWPALYESTPAPATGSGRSLARRPDGHDTDDNGADLVAAAPTPGAANFARRALTLLRHHFEPPSTTRPGSDVRVELDLRATGLESLGATVGRLYASGFAWAVDLPTLAAGDSLSVAVAVAWPDTGRWPSVLEWPLPDLGETLTVTLDDYAVGPRGIVIAEIMAAPRAGGEWIELQNVGTTPADPAGLRFRDADGDWRALPPGPVLLPGERLVLVEDPEDFLATWSTMPPAAGSTCEGSTLRVERPAGWPSLNNTAPESRCWADRVLLADTLGVVDHVTIGPASELGAGRAVVGRSVERLAPVAASSEAANWATCAVPAGGTPGCPNSASAIGPAGNVLTARPNPCMLASGGYLHLHFGLSDPEGGFDLRIYDLWGALVRDLAADGLGPGPRHLIWDGRDDRGQVVPSGGYVALLRRRDAAGRIVRAEKILLAVVGGGDG